MLVCLDDSKQIQSLDAGWMLLQCIEDSGLGFRESMLLNQGFNFVIVNRRSGLRLGRQMRAATKQQTEHDCTNRMGERH